MCGAQSIEIWPKWNASKIEIRRNKTKHLKNIRLKGYERCFHRGKFPSRPEEKFAIYAQEVDKCEVSIQAEVYPLTSQPLKG